jgi:hypothetical protein
VRIYNRALSAAEIKALYTQRSNATPQAGQIVFNQKNAAMMYCDGSNWRMMGLGSYNPTAIHIADGATDYFNRGGGLTGLVDGTVASGSVWFKTSATPATGGAVQEIFASTRSSDNNCSFCFGLADPNVFSVAASNSADAQRLFMTSAALTPNDGNWHHALFSFDITDASKRAIFIDDVQDFVVTTYINDTLNFVDLDHNIGRGKATAANSQFVGDMADLWLDFGTYLYVSSMDVRRKFISPAGMPMYLGADGSIPTGSAPDVFLSGDVIYWQSNKGTGGDFNVNGTIGYAATQPADDILVTASTAPDLTTGLAGHWSFDEGSGTSAGDSSGNGNTGTLTNMDNTNWVDGIYGTALQFNGIDEWVNVPNSASLNITSSNITLSAWVKSIGGQGNDTGIVVKDDAGKYNYMLSWQTGNRFSFRTNTSCCSGAKYQVIGQPGSLYDERWYHVAGVYNGSEHRAFVNGALIETLGQTGTIDDSSLVDLVIGRRRIGDNRFFSGVIDDVRVYNRALSDAEVAYMYQQLNPAGYIKYDSAMNVMMYFNGAEWTAMGPIAPNSDPSPTNGLLVHLKLDETSGGTATDAQGNYNGTVIGDQIWYPNDGKIQGALLNGNNDAINLGDVNEVEGANNFTLSGWFRFDSVPTLAARQFRLFNKYGTAAGQYTFRIMLNSSDNRIIYYTHQSDCSTSQWNGGRYFSEGDVGRWFHIVVTYDSVEPRLRAYIDGISDLNTKTVPSPLCSDTSPLVIGANNAGTGNEFVGLIDDVRIYSRALAPGEVWTLYQQGANGGLTIPETGCANPARDEGAMLYDSDHNYMMYCNGQSWIGIGK